MTAEELRNKSKSYWMLTEEQIRHYEKITHTPHYIALNISTVLTEIINRQMQLASEQGKMQTTVDLFSATSFQGWQIRDMMPYLRWYYMKDGFDFTMKDCEVTIGWAFGETI